MKKKRKRIMWILVLGLLGIVVFVGWKTSRAGYESPDYAVVRSFDEYEIRLYPTLTAVAAPMSNDSSGNRNSGFGQLFRYISGGNEKEQKIAMTTPVFIEEGNQPSMMFLMPKTVAEAGAPEPKGESLGVKPIKTGEFAALRFSGYRSESKQQEALGQLKELVEKSGRNITGPPIFAFYDPPWTPEFLRRNEVLLRLAPED